MPYIKEEDRSKFDIPAKEIAEKAENAGCLNYAITVILHNYINKKGLKYANLNEVHGMLDCCNKELYRRITGPYEDSCIKRNGDAMYVEALQNKKYTFTFPDAKKLKLEESNIFNDLFVLINDVTSKISNNEKTLVVDYLIESNPEIIDKLLKNCANTDFQNSRIGKFKMLQNNHLRNKINIVLVNPKGNNIIESIELENWSK